MTAQGEKVVVYADPIHLQDLFPYFRQRRFQTRLRRNVGRGRRAAGCVPGRWNPSAC